MNGGFRTSSIQASSSNKIEYAELSNWLQWGFVFACFIYIVVTSLFWGELMYITFPKSLISFYLILAAYIFSLSFPVIACFIGYMWAKITEYNRYMDTTSVVGGIAGQLAMNSGNIAKHYMEAVDTGRQMQMEIELNSVPEETVGFDLEGPSLQEPEKRN